MSPPAFMARRRHTPNPGHQCFRAVHLCSDNRAIHGRIYWGSRPTFDTSSTVARPSSLHLHPWTHSTLTFLTPVQIPTSPSLAQFDFPRKIPRRGLHHRQRRHANSGASTVSPFIPGIVSWPSIPCVQKYQLAGFHPSYGRSRLTLSLVPQVLGGFYAGEIEVWSLQVVHRAKGGIRILGTSLLTSLEE